MDDLQDRFPLLPPRIAGLGELAYNLWWSWHPGARMLFKLLDRGAWKATRHNPVKLLRVLPPQSLETAAADPEYLRRYDAVLADFKTQTQTQTQVCWFTENIIPGECLPIAYFSLEYGLHHSLPFYAGGLGFLAGDHLKECSDLGIPMVAVGFMYPGGYMRQQINADGWQEGVDEILDRDAAPISRILDGKGGQLTVQVPFTDPPIHVAVWQVMVGRIPLYLMDTDLEINEPAHRKISNHLYISDREQRLLQEIVLGIGGSRMLAAMGIKHSVLHMNEGHPAFALLEKVRERVEAGMSYEESLQQVRATSVFTTHTPVPAGHDVFPFDLVDKYICQCYPMLDRDEFLRLGVSPTDPPGAGFNLTAFALRMSTYHNGVSRIHGEVSRSMWQALWPELPVEQVPIDHVTNGVHVPTWIDPKLELRCMDCGGPQWVEEHDKPEIWQLVDDIPDGEFWSLHYRKKAKLVNFIRERTRQRWVYERIGLGNVVVGGALLDPSALTLGFARRFATYKRADLIFQDLERLKRLLNEAWRPVQIIFAGKAHPADDPGKRILQRIFNFARDPDFGGRIAFVEDYGEQVAQYLVHGVDVWLNNPLPPLEACGTSGMKAAINGVLHLSILDGWWPEGFNGKNGWAFAGAAGEDRDARDAAAIYEILEKEVVPLYYRVNDQGVPEDWVQMMKEAMKSLGAKFSARRMVKEYSRKFYQPALAAAGS